MDWLTIDIHDDFDLGKIRDSGQCFTIRKTGPDAFRFITGDHTVTLREVPIDSTMTADIEECPSGMNPNALPAHRIAASCDSTEWFDVWHDYFDMGTSYWDMRRHVAGRNPKVDDMLDYGEGMRLLRQDPWEALVSFIISQRKMIPAIEGCVSTLSREFGQDIGGVHAFPSVDALYHADIGDIRSCGVGYRDRYIKNAAKLVHDGMLDLAELSYMNDSKLVSALETIQGVGDKVASCTALFGYHRMGVVPVDVWIQRALDDTAVCDDGDLFDLYPGIAGMIQQYVYYWIRGTRYWKD